MDVELNISYRNSATVEITGTTNDLFVVEFIDQKTNTSVHKDTLIAGMWTKTKRRYYTDWKIIVTTIDGISIKEESINLRGQEVLISLGSNSLGDNLAWIPASEEF